MTGPAHKREDSALVLALLRSAQSFHRAIGPVLRREGLTAAQWDVLETLSHKGPLTVNGLLERALGTSGNMDVVVKNLMRAGLVKKSVAKEDRRSRVVALTEAGRGKVRQVTPLHDAALARIFGALDRAEKREAIKALNRLRHAVTDSQEDTTSDKPNLPDRP